MKPQRLMQQLILAGLGSLLVSSAWAQADPGFWYGGLSVGKARHKVDESAVAAGALGGAAVTGITSDERDTAYKLFGGYQFNRHIALEGGFFDLGDTRFSATAPGGPLTQSSSVKGINLDLVGTLPITERFSLLGRVGAAYGRNRTSFGGAGAAGIGNPNPSDKKTYPKVGLGVQYEINRSFWIRGEVERYRVSNAVGGRHYVDTAMVGLVFPFGRAPERVAAAPAPAPFVAPPPAVVQAPAPPPPPPPPPPPAPRQVTLKASSLFGFDRAELQAAGKAELDKLANELKTTNYQTVVVEGHTDRLGSNAYNQKLSEERAAAVRSYLVSSGGVSSEKISAVGKGETQPVTQPGECKGNKATATLVACLQPDRRVVVVVDGTR